MAKNSYHVQHYLYLKQLAELPQKAPAADEVWPAHIVDLYQDGMIQKIGGQIFLTEKGHALDGAISPSRR